MKLIRRVVVFDAADIDAESKFWADMLDGRVIADDDFHCVIDADGRWVIGVQLAPDHVPPSWPDGEPQQLHLDLHAEDAAAAIAQAEVLGARVLFDGHDLGAEEGHRVFADPAGHPFCIGWGQPDDTQLRTFLAGHE